MNVYRCSRCRALVRTDHADPGPCGFCGAPVSDRWREWQVGEVVRIWRPPALYATYRSGPLPPGLPLWGADDDAYRPPRAPWVLTPADVIYLRIEGIDPEVEAC
jgi:DNA-directed RNA polymerase subunit RPC12/RpoP